MDNDRRVGARYAIDLPVRELTSENWTLLDATADLQLVGRNVWHHLRNIGHATLDHHLKININFDSLGFILHFPLSFLLLQVVHLLPSVFSVLLQPLDLVQAIVFLGGLPLHITRPFNL